MKNILVMGASSGIGYGLVKKFINYNYHVFTVSRSIDTLSTLKLQHKNLTIIQADITNINHQIDIINKISIVDSIEIINSIAVGIPQPFNGSNMSELRHHFETNFFAPIVT